MLWERDTFKNQDQDEDKYRNLNKVTSVRGMPRNIRQGIKEPVSMGKWSCNMSSLYSKGDVSIFGIPDINDCITCLARVIAVEPE